MLNNINPSVVRIRHILLHSWDPIGIAEYENASDEYNGYADRVFEMMQGGANVDDVKSYLYNASKNDIGLDYPGLLEKSELAAREILQSGGTSRKRSGQ